MRQFAVAKAKNEDGNLLEFHFTYGLTERDNIATTSTNSICKDNHEWNEWTRIRSFKYHWLCDR